MLAAKASLIILSALCVQGMHLEVSSVDASASESALDALHCAEMPKEAHQSVLLCDFVISA